MVTGLETFRRHFAGVKDAFVVIGGAACAEWFAQTQVSFRSTKDVDIVLVLEASVSTFGPVFWEFVRAGGYKTAQRMDGKKTLYRFQKPSATDYPAMLELFAGASLGVEANVSQAIVPIRAGEDVSSLSAILMDREYYDFIMEQREVHDELPLIKPAGLIALKARAWLDLSRRRAENPSSVKEQDVNKHRSDIFRLTSILPAGESIQAPDRIAEDLRRFLAAFPETSPEWSAIHNALKSAGIAMLTRDLRATFQTYFSLTGGSA